MNIQTYNIFEFIELNNLEMYTDYKERVSNHSLELDCGTVSERFGRRRQNQRGRTGGSELYLAGKRDSGQKCILASR